MSSGKSSWLSVTVDSNGSGAPFRRRGPSRGGDGTFQGAVTLSVSANGAAGGARRWPAPRIGLAGLQTGGRRGVGENGSREIARRILRAEFLRAELRRRTAGCNPAAGAL